MVEATASCHYAWWQARNECQALKKVIEYILEKGRISDLIVRRIDLQNSYQTVGKDWGRKKRRQGHG